MTIVQTLLLAATFATNPSPRALSTTLEVEAPVAKAWHAWTTREGVTSFFAPDCRLDLRVDGAYDILFTPEAAPGNRGAEGMRILAIEPMRRFAFTWNAPPSIPQIRGQRTMVIVDFEAVDAQRTRLTFTHLGWGEGRSWNDAYDYFDHAWNDIVLPRFVYAMQTGPINWQAPPALKPLPR